MESKLFDLQLYHIMADCALKNLHFFSLDIFFFQISFTIIIETPNLTYDYIRIFCKCRLKNGLQICLKLTTERKKNDDDDNINRNGRKKDVAQVYILSRSILHYLVQIQRFAYKPNTR